MEEKEIDHEYTDEIVCPHCGYEHTDSWERESNSGDAKCHHCSKDFFYERNISVSYSTLTK